MVLHGWIRVLYVCIWVSFEGVALACPGSATDVIRGLWRRVCCALGMFAGSKQGLVPLPGPLRRTFAHDGREKARPILKGPRLEVGGKSEEAGPHFARACACSKCGPAFSDLLPTWGLGPSKIGQASSRRHGVGMLGTDLGLLGGGAGGGGEGGGGPWPFWLKVMLK